MARAAADPRSAATCGVGGFLVEAFGTSVPAHVFRLREDDKTTCQRLGVAAPCGLRRKHRWPIRSQDVFNVMKRCFYLTQPGKQAPTISCTQKSLGARDQRSSQPPVVNIISE